MRNKSNLRKEAVFSTQVYKGVRWVPVNTLGESRYSNFEMMRIILLKYLCFFSNNDIIKKINTLYEAVQYLQIGNFKVKCDNEIFVSEGVEW